VKHSRINLLTEAQPNDRKRFVALKLSVIARQLRLKFDQTITQRGVTRAKWSLIAAVASKPGVTQRAIATMLEVTEVTAGRLIDRLCTDGYLERRENPNDRRGYCVYLTPAAQPVLDQMDEVAKIHEEEFFANMNDGDLAKLDELLSTIAKNLAISQSHTETRIHSVSNDSTD
jgi:MarR family transcriptional regulator, transcriptional regulator for hemolysin